MKDTAPISMLELHPAQYTSTLYLDLTKLLRALENKQKFIAQNETRFASMHVLKNHEEKPSEELLDYLTQRWTGIELQKELPFSDRLDRLIGIGMTPAHSLQKVESAQNNNISPGTFRPGNPSPLGIRKNAVLYFQ